MSWLASKMKSSKLTGYTKDEMVVAHTLLSMSMELPWESYREKYIKREKPVSTMATDQPSTSHPPVTSLRSAIIFLRSRIKVEPSSPKFHSTPRRKSNRKVKPPKRYLSSTENSDEDEANSTIQRPKIKNEEINETSTILNGHEKSLKNQEVLKVKKPLREKNSQQMSDPNIQKVVKIKGEIENVKPNKNGQANEANNAKVLTVREQVLNNEHLRDITNEVRANNRKKKQIRDLLEKFHNNVNDMIVFFFSQGTFAVFDSGYNTFDKTKKLDSNKRRWIDVKDRF